VINTILFDFDGLIIDTETPIFTAWRQMYEEYGCTLTVEEYSACLGTNHDAFDPYKDLETKAGKILPWDKLRPRISACYTDLINANDALPGIRECLAEARQRGLRLAVASSSTREWVTTHLARLELLPYFDAIRTRDDVTRVKPAPDLFQAGLACLDAHPGETFVLEDSPNGILAAKRAGVFAVAVPNWMTSQLHLNDPDLCIPSLEEVPLEDLLKKIAERKRAVET